MICKYCGLEVLGRIAGAHVINCKQNPNREITNKKKSNSLKINNCMFNEKHRKTLSDKINKKVKDGTWHNSFSKSRVHEYNGIKLYGMWEVNYAKWLDKNNIKWRRPTETFVYYFNNKKHRYTPDFYLLDSNEYIEVKGYKTPKDDAKWKQFPLKLKILMGKDLFEMKIIDSYKILKEK